jgi:hypothetical protein
MRGALPSQDSWDETSALGCGQCKKHSMIVDGSGNLDPSPILHEPVTGPMHDPFRYRQVYSQLSHHAHPHFSRYLRSCLGQDTVLDLELDLE